MFSRLADLLGRFVATTVSAIVSVVVMVIIYGVAFTLFVTVAVLATSILETYPGEILTLLFVLFVAGLAGRALWGFFQGVPAAFRHTSMTTRFDHHLRAPTERHLQAVDQWFAWISLMLPPRVVNEVIGDGMELLDRHEKAGATKYRLWVGAAFIMFWALVEAVKTLWSTPYPRSMR